MDNIIPLVASQEETFPFKRNFVQLACTTDSVRTL